MLAPSQPPGDPLRAPDIQWSKYVMSISFWFPATAKERRDLAAAIAHNCECTSEGGPVVLCTSHAMILGETPADRRVLEGLLYVRRVLLPRLRTEEFNA